MTLVLILYETRCSGRTNCLLSFDMTWTTQKTMPAIILYSCRNVFTKLLPSNNSGLLIQTHRLSFDKLRIAYKITCPTILLSLHAFLAMGMCLPSHCIAPKGVIRLIQPLPCNHRRDTHTDTQADRRDLQGMPLKWA
jgi:hypothetical protein